MPIIKAGAIDLDCERSGSGPPLLMIMGMSGVREHWGQPFLDALRAELAASYDFLPPATLARLARAYGTQAFDMLGDAVAPADLGCPFVAGLYQREVDWLVGNEWAHTAEDILWRRSKLGLRLTAPEVAALRHYLARQAAALD